MSLPHLCLQAPVLAFLHHRRIEATRFLTALHRTPLTNSSCKDYFSITCPVVVYFRFALVWIWGFVAIPFVRPFVCSPLFHHLLKQAPGLAEEARCVPVIKVAYLVADSESHPRLGPALKEKRQKEVSSNWEERRVLYVALRSATTMALTVVPPLTTICLSRELTKVPACPNGGLQKGASPTPPPPAATTITPAAATTSTTTPAPPPCSTCVAT